MTPTSFHIKLIHLMVQDHALKQIVPHMRCDSPEWPTPKLRGSGFPSTLPEEVQDPVFIPLNLAENRSSIRRDVLNLFERKINNGQSRIDMPSFTADLGEVTRFIHQGIRNGETSRKTLCIFNRPYPGLASNASNALFWLYRVIFEIEQSLSSVRCQLNTDLRAPLR